MAVISKHKDEYGEKPILMLWPGHDAVLIKQTNKSAFSWMHLEFPNGSLFNSLKEFLSFYLLISYEEEVGNSCIWLSLEVQNNERKMGFTMD